VACAAPGLGPDQALRLTLARVRALETQWQRQGRGGGRGQSAPPPANDAMADALRRAGLVDPKQR
ncbi:hypothetical protein ACWEPO_29800, partial [Streptomyces albidoflavus]